MKAGFPIIAIDGVGLWWGLKVGVNEKGEPDSDHVGLKIVVFGGQHADLPLPLTSMGKGKRVWQSVDDDKLRLMVKAILESHISAVLDTTGLSKNLKHHIVAIFLSELMRLYEIDASKYGTRHIFIEEASTWCPQRGLSGDVAQSTGAIESLVMQGGNYNLGCTLITQRSAALNKNALSQAGCLLALRILHKLDKNAVKGWVESVANPDDPRIAKWYDGLRELKNGDVWVWKPEPPEHKIFKKVHVRPRETLHATREYFRRTGKPVKPVDVSEFVNKFRKVFEPPKPKVVEAPKPIVIPTTPFQPNPITGQALQPPKDPLYPFVDAQGIPRNYSGMSPPIGPPIPVPMSVPSVILPTSQGVTYGLPEPEPKSTLGRLLLVLYKNTDRAGNRKYTLSSLLQLLADSGWTIHEEDLRQSIQYLLQVQMLEPVQARSRGVDYRFIGRDRVQLVPQQLKVELP